MVQSKSKSSKKKAAPKKKAIGVSTARLDKSEAAAKSKAPAKNSRALTKKKVTKKAKAAIKKPNAPEKKAVKTVTAPKPAASVAPKPRPTSKKTKLKFKAGDYVVYPTHGVGLVQGIERETIAGHRLELVVVTFDNDRMTLRVPMEKMDTSGLRELSNRKTMDNAMTTLRGRARIKRTMWSRRAQEYEAKINSGDPISIAEVVRDLHRNVGQPDQSFSERQIYESALERLAGEVAAVDGTDKENAVEKLEHTLKSSS